MEKNKSKGHRRKLKSCSIRPACEQEWRIDVGTYHWEAEPSVDRVVHGIPNQLDSIKALGNSVIPAQARLAFELLIGIKMPEEL